MSESLPSAVPPVEIPGTIVGEVHHPTSVERVLAGSPSTPSPAAPATDDPPAESPAEASAGATPVAEPVTEKSAEPATEKPEGAAKEPGRRTGMASNGKPVTELPPPPDAPVWPAFAPDAPGAPATPNGLAAVDESYVPDEEFDATDLMQVNRELNRARARIFRCSQTLKRVQRALAEAQVDYDRQMRRALVTQSGGTAESRRALAEIQCEEFENRVVIGKQVVEEWRRRCNDARDDLKALENISHNVRASLDIR